MYGDGIKVYKLGNFYMVFEKFNNNLVINIMSFDIYRVEILLVKIMYNKRDIVNIFLKML